MLTPTYLSLGEIEFFPPQQTQNGIFGTAIDLSGQTLISLSGLINPLVRQE